MSGGSTDTLAMRTRGLLLSAAFASCSMHAAYQQATLPEGEGPWVAPLLDPLTADHAVIDLELASADGKSKFTSTAMLDTGAWRSVVDGKAAEALGLEVTTTSRILMTDVSGHQRPWRGMVVPEAKIGELTLAGFGCQTGVEGAGAVVGNEVIARLPVEIDRDRGVVVFGASPWRAAEGTIGLEPGAEREPARVKVQLDGRDVLFILDTGAYATTLDLETGNGFGLEKKHLLEPRRYFGLHNSAVAFDFEFAVPRLGFGDMQLEGLEIEPVPKMQQGGALNEKVVGLLGMDVLKRFRLRIDNQAGKVELLRRGDLVAGTAERIGRWRWAPRCDGSPGCVTASHTLTPAGDGKAGVLDVVARAEAAYDNPVRLLFGFVDGGGRLVDALPVVELQAGKLAAGDVLSARATLEGKDAAYLAPLFAGEAAVHLILLDVNRSYDTRRKDHLKVLEPLAGWKAPGFKMRMKRNAKLGGKRFLSYSPAQLDKCLVACEVDQRCAAVSYRERRGPEASECALLREAGAVEDAAGVIAAIKP